MALFSSPLNTQLACIVISLALYNFPCQRLWNVAVEGFGHHRQLGELGHWLDAWYDRYGDAHLTGFLHKLEILLVVIEQLCYSILRP